MFVKSSHLFGCVQKICNFAPLNLSNQSAMGL